MSQIIMAIDQGTTGSTVLLVKESGDILARGYQEFPQIYPKSGWVEHDPEAIWDSVVGAMYRAFKRSGANPEEVAAIGITNQRETTIVWERKSGRPIHNAIVWQCRRTSQMCQDLKQQGLEPTFKARTGLVLDPYFSGTKVAWILNQVPGAREQAEAGELAFGTVDSFLIHRLTGGQKHVTDASNASRTLLFNIRDMEWDSELCAHLDVPMSVLPEVVENAGRIGVTKGVPGLPDGIPIAGVAGDQQAALFGQTCFAVGEGKITYGTGAFLLVNTGQTCAVSEHGLLTTVAWKLDGKVTYAFEGSAFIAGAAVQWLRDGLNLIETAPDVEDLARSVEDTDGVYFVPALTGLGAPHWRADARGAITGITRGTTRAHLARATLEGIAFQNYDIMKAMEDDLGKPLKSVRVDGGACANDLLMQMQADLLGVEILRPQQVETTAIGAAFLAGLGAGVWDDLSEVRQAWKLDRSFKRAADEHSIREKLNGWKQAVERV